MSAAGWMSLAVTLTTLWAPTVMVTLAGAGAASAQTADTRGVQDVPSGDGTLRGVVRHPDGPAKTAGLSVALYALDADGTPSLRNTTTDATGAFRFLNISSASGITYLVGARYREIPYGTRVHFESGGGSEAGESSRRAGDPASPVIDVVIDVADPTSDVSAIEVSESRVEIGWMGNSLAIQESHLLVNGGDAVVYVGPDARGNAAPAFVGHLPEAASNFTPAFGSLQSDFERRPGGALRFWGAIHPGEQSVSYRYLLPASGDRVAFEPRFPSGSRAVTILVPVEEPEISATGAVPDEEVEISGQRFRTWVAGPLEPGSRIALQLEAPAQREDSDALEITLANAWLELDDTALTVLVEYTLLVPPGGRLVGTPQSPLLRFSLPPGAELIGLSPNASRLGLRRGREGGPGSDGGALLELLGPIPSGETQLSYRYQVPASREEGSAESGTGLDLRFPRHLPQLNVMVADTGVVVTDDRMHRRRPTRAGTRLYLHREAFQVSPSETISLRLTPLERRRLSPALALAPVLLGAAVAAWFMVAPLRPSESTPQLSSSALSTRDRRESIYGAIRDLDHDFETGKISQHDHSEMRAELRHQAVELMRLEAQPQPADPSSCTACGGKIDPQWTFCAACGQAIPDRPGPGVPSA